MHNLDYAFRATNVEVGAYSDTADTDGHAVVVVKLLVPHAAKVPALHQPLETARLRLRPAAVSSTVPGPARHGLQGSSTARPTDWSTTLTLRAAPGRPAPSGREA